MEILKKDINLYYKLWDKVDNPFAILQIFHGMVEHIERYDEFAKYLNSKGIIVYGMDMRGHGKTGLESKSLGAFAKKDGWGLILKDQKDLHDLMVTKYPNLKRVLLGHSMGSFLARNYINEHALDFDKAIIMGTGKADDSSFKLARLILKFFNPLRPAKFMNSMAFGSYNKFFEHPKTDFDWLSRDEEEVKKYIDDPLCGFLVKNSFYKDFMKGMEEVTLLERNPNKEIDLFFVSGDKDPVGGMGRYVDEASRIYKQAEIKLYQNMRHEILNEIGREEVYEDIALWINK